jgi:hypothetical protein
MLFFLFAAHALMDFALQGDAIATCKCRGAGTQLQKSVPWYYWLSAHAILHGAAVGVVVQWFGYGFEVAVILGVIETVIHWFIDLGKCEKYFDIHVDQGLHLLCKVVWWALLMFTPFAGIVVRMSGSA